MPQQSNKQNITIQQVLTALLDEENAFPYVYLQQFSDLEGADVETLRSVWPQVATQRRVNVMEDLEELQEVDMIMLFDEIAKIGLADSDPRVRVIALRMLWDNDAPDLAKTFLAMLRDDPAGEVRAGAASALGNYVYLGELEEIPESLLRRVEDALLSVLKGSDETLVRRRALEALGFSGRKEVEQHIRAAYQTEEADWQASALFAMGRSANDEWSKQVLRSLRDPKLNVLLEAVRAAGELEIQDARELLLRIATEDDQDSDLRNAAFWSLSKIGGEDVREVIEQRMDEIDDAEELEYLEGVLDNLSFTEDMGLFQMFDMDGLGEDAELIEEDPEEGAAADEEEQEKPNTPQKPAGRNRHKPRRH